MHKKWYAQIWFLETMHRRKEERTIEEETVGSMRSPTIHYKRTHLPILLLELPFTYLAPSHLCKPSNIPVLLCMCQLGIKLCLHCSEMVTRTLVPRPNSFLAFTAAIGYISTSTAILCFATFHSSTWDTALWVVTMSHLCDRFHVFVPYIQAAAGNAPSEEVYECVFIGFVRVFKFRQIG